MKISDCPLCFSRKKQIVRTQTFKDDYLDLIDRSYQSAVRQIVTCQDCGFTYRDPSLDKNDLEVLYAHFRDISFRNETPDQYFDRITGLAAKESENSAKVQWLKARIPKRLANPGNILDIGCGGGVFLHSFSKSFPNWNLHGVEPTSSFAELAARRLGETVIDGSYQSKMFNTKFDLITMIQVLEHVISPVDFLLDVANDLTPSGLVYLEVPDIKDLDFLPDNHDRFHMQHLSIFSKDSLKRTCLKAGYKIEAIDQSITIRGKNNLNALLSRQ